MCILPITFLHVPNELNGHLNRIVGKNCLFEMPTSYHWEITENDVKTATIWGSVKCNENEITLVLGSSGKKTICKAGERVSVGIFDKVYHVSLKTLASSFDVEFVIPPGNTTQFRAEAEVGVDENQMLEVCEELIKRPIKEVRSEITEKLVSSINAVATKLLKKNGLKVHHFVSAVKREVNPALLQLGLFLRELKITNVKGDHGCLSFEATERKEEDKSAQLRKEGKEKLTKIVQAHKATSEELRKKEEMLELALKQLPLVIQELLRKEESTIEQQAAQILMAESTAEATRIEGEANAEVILSTERARVEHLKSQAEKYEALDDSHFAEMKLEALQKAVESVTDVLRPHADALREAIPPSEYVKDIMKIVEATPHMIEWMTGVDILAEFSLEQTENRNASAETD